LLQGDVGGSSSESSGTRVNFAQGALGDSTSQSSGVVEPSLSLSPDLPKEPLLPNERTSRGRDNCWTVPTGREENSFGCCIIWLVTDRLGSICAFGAIFASADTISTSATAAVVAVSVHALARRDSIIAVVRRDSISSSE
jgi:hypothetical protein